MDVLLLKLRGPMISFGAPMIDEYGFTHPHPTQSMITGLTANALGIDRSETAYLTRLQNSIIYACREDKTGRKMTDFQTVDLGQPHLLAKGKTNTSAWRAKTRGVHFRGGGSSDGTHIRYRDYWADALYTVALISEDDVLNTVRIAHAFKAPERPLFIGRKCCVPSRPIFHKLATTNEEGIESLISVLQNEPADEQTCAFWWPATDNRPGVHQIELSDQRDFKKDCHTGSRILAHEHLNIHV